MAAVLGDADLTSHGRAFRASLLIWQLLHGTVGLRISRSVFPWPPVAETVTGGVELILDGAMTA